jgi:hypothetical protein
MMHEETLFEAGAVTSHCDRWRAGSSKAGKKQDNTRRDYSINLPKLGSLRSPALSSAWRI